MTASRKVGYFGTKGSSFDSRINVSKETLWKFDVMLRFCDWKDYSVISTKKGKLQKERSFATVRMGICLKAHKSQEKACRSGSLLTPYLNLYYSSCWVKFTSADPRCRKSQKLDLKHQYIFILRIFEK
jgi:hypothetical protein